MIINLVNNAINLRYREDKAIVKFSTDATAPITTTGTSTGGSQIAVANGSSFIAGDLITVANANAAGTGNWYNQAGSVGPTTLYVGLPAVITSVTNTLVSRWERFDTRFRPCKVRLVNLTNLDMHEWFKGMPTRTAIKTAAAGSKTLIVGNSIWVNHSTTGIFPDLLPVSCDYVLELNFEYRS